MARRPFEEYRSDAPPASIEDDWIAEIESDPTDLDYLLGIAEPLAAAGEGERARGLLELLDSELVSGGHWPARFELLRRAAPLYLKPAKLQRELVVTLQALWPGKPNLQAMIEYVALHKTTEDPARLWDKATRLQNLLVFDVGEVVAMASQGVGRVVDVNLPLETLKIDFEKKKGVMVGFRAAGKMLTPLPPGHLLRRKLEDPEGLAQLREEQPAELLRAVLESADKALTAGEIRDMLAGVVSESQWTAWWNAARKHPQVTTAGGGRLSYRWEASAEGAVASIANAFEVADPAGQLDLFRKNAGRDAKLAETMARKIAAAAGSRRQSDPAFAFEAWYALERAGKLPRDLGWSVDDLLGTTSDVRKLAAGLEDRLLRERAFGMLRERREDWTKLYRDFLTRETDPRAISFLAEGLGEGAAGELERWLDDLLSQPRKQPAAFVWLVERAADDEALRARNPIRLLQQLLLALANEEFAPFRTRLRAQTESGGTLPRIFSLLSEEQAPAALEAIERTSALDSAHKAPLRNALLLRFPELREEQSSALYALLPSIQTKQAEMKRLAEVEIPANRKAIEEARALGDLRENFEYKSARQRHEYLNARLAMLHRDLGRARPIDLDAVDVSEVRIGSSVTLLGEARERRVFSILGPWESRPESGILSYESDLGQKLLGLKPGDTFEIGSARFVVESIVPWRES